MSQLLLSPPSQLAGQLSMEEAEPSSHGRRTPPHPLPISMSLCVRGPFQLPAPHPSWYPGSQHHPQAPHLLLVAAAGALLGCHCLRWTTVVEATQQRNQSRTAASQTQPGLAFCVPNRGEGTPVDCKMPSDGSSCVILGMLHNCSVPQFPHM